MVDVDFTIKMLLCFNLSSLSKWEWVGVVIIMDSFSNHCGTLSFHRQSLKGTVQDWKIEFNRNQLDIPTIVGDTNKLFLMLVESFSDKIVFARLVAKVDFNHFGKEEVEERSFHFASYSTEEVCDPSEFYERHMEKIAQRLVAFNHHGSNLVIKTISHIHIQLSFKQRH